MTQDLLINRNNPPVRSCSMKLFISHAHEEAKIARALRNFLRKTGISLEAFYSSSPDTKEGITVGRWRDKIGHELRDADTIITIFTPDSLRKPWIYFECAYAWGFNEKTEYSVKQADKIIPVIYFMGKDSITSPLQDLHILKGDDKDEVVRLYQILIDRTKGEPIADELLQIAIDQYKDEIADIGQSRFDKALFHSHFHNHITGKKLEGDWHAIWTEIDPEGNETPFFSDDIVTIWSTNERIRMVGKGKDWADYYPMEGVLSPNGQIALSYWSQEENPICGGALLKLIGGNRIMVGNWMGHTAKSLYDDLKIVRGKAYFAKVFEDGKGLEALEKITAHLRE